MKSSSLQVGLYALPNQARLRQAIRDRAQTTVKDPFTLKSRVTASNARKVICELNNTIGMNAYEIVTYTLLDDNWVDAEIIVPGRALALKIKLTWGGL